MFIYTIGDIIGLAALFILIVGYVSIYVYEEFKKWRKK